MTQFFSKITPNVDLETWSNYALHEKFYYYFAFLWFVTFESKQNTHKIDCRWWLRAQLGARARPCFDELVEIFHVVSDCTTRTAEIYNFEVSHLNFFFLQSCAWWLLLLFLLLHITRHTYCILLNWSKAHRLMVWVVSWRAASSSSSCRKVLEWAKNA